MAKGLRVIVIPATQKIYMQAIEEGLVQTFIRAGAVVSTPTCGPCLGGYMGMRARQLQQQVRLQVKSASRQILDYKNRIRMEEQHESRRQSI